MSQSLIIKYTPTPQDYARVLRRSFLKHTGIRISLAIPVVAFGLILYAILSKGSPPTVFELIWLFVPPLFLIFVVFFVPYRTAQQAAGNEQLITETTWEVNDNGVEISSNFGATHLGWEELEKLETTREYYFLLFKAKKYDFRFVPRRAFISPQQQTQFLELMTHHLSKE